MAIVYEEMAQPLIANTVMHEGRSDGTLTVYKIKAAEGYVLHDKRGDSPIYDEDGNETGETKPRFRVGTAIVSASYDFDNVVAGTYNGINGVIQVQKVGVNEFYAIPDTEVPVADTWDLKTPVVTE